MIQLSPARARAAHESLCLWTAWMLRAGAGDGWADRQVDGVDLIRSLSRRDPAAGGLMFRMEASGQPLDGDLAGIATALAAFAKAMDGDTSDLQPWMLPLALEADRFARKRNLHSRFPDRPILEVEPITQDLSELHVAMVVGGTQPAKTFIGYSREDLMNQMVVHYLLGGLVPDAAGLPPNPRSSLSDDKIVATFIPHLPGNPTLHLTCEMVPASQLRLIARNSREVPIPAVRRHARDTIHRHLCRKIADLLRADTPAAHFWRRAVGPAHADFVISSLECLHPMAGRRLEAAMNVAHLVPNPLGSVSPVSDALIAALGYWQEWKNGKNNLVLPISDRVMEMVVEKAFATGPGGFSPSTRTQADDSDLGFLAGDDYAVVGLADDGTCIFQSPAAGRFSSTTRPEDLGYALSPNEMARIGWLVEVEPELPDMDLATRRPALTAGPSVP